MTKKIERSRIESGKVELPRKLGFLTTEKVDFLSVTDRDGEFSVEMPVAALSKLVKAKGELKALKSERKSDAAGHASALGTEKDAHAETRAALAKAERRIKALTKRLEAGTSSDDSATAAKAAGGSGKAAGKGRGAAADAGASSTIESVAPAAPKKVSAKKAVAKAAEAVVAPEASTQGPAALL
jgi:hypothetical protein